MSLIVFYDQPQKGNEGGTREIEIIHSHKHTLDTNPERVHPFAWRRFLARVPEMCFGRNQVLYWHIMRKQRKTNSNIVSTRIRIKPIVMVTTVRKYFKLSTTPSSLMKSIHLDQSKVIKKERQREHYRKCKLYRITVFFRRNNIIILE